MLRVEHLDDAASFLAATERLRGDQPALTNVLGSIARGVVEGRRYDEVRWWAVRDDAGAVVGAALRTSPFALVASPMTEEAAAALAGDVLVSDPAVPGLVAPVDVATAVLARWRSPERSRIVEVVMVLDRLVPPRPVAGGPRVAVAADLPRMVAWNLQFAHDAGLPSHDVDDAMRWRVEQRSLWWWTVDDVPVAMAGHAPAVDTPAGRYARIGPVYTPLGLRGRGYGGAVTAALAAHLVGSGATVMLHADASNATSVGLYERLGFRAVGSLLDVTLG